MYDLINPLINLAAANTAALTRFALAPTSDLQDNGRLIELWHATMTNQARFATEYTTSMLGILARQRVVLNGQMEKLSRDTEQVASELAHTAVRAVAIATQARRNGQDRRVFPLPLPGERRQPSRTDRRLSLNDYMQATGT